MIGRPFIFLYEDALDGRVIKVTELTANSEIESARKRNDEHGGLALAVIVA
jgi:hypothetical protein